MNLKDIEEIVIKFNISVPPIVTKQLVKEWELHCEAHNGFDNYLAHTLLNERKQKDETIKKLEEVVLEMGGVIINAGSDFTHGRINVLLVECQSKHAETIKSIKERRK